MNKLARYFAAAVAACASFVSFAADTPPAGVTLVDLTTPSSGSVSSSGAIYNNAANYSAAKAFDGVTSGSDNRWLTKSVADAWVVYQFNEPTVVNAYTIVNGGSGGANHDTRAVKDFTLKGSNDGETWTTLDTRTGETGWTSGESRFFFCQTADNVAYTYYKFQCTANNGQALVQIHEIYFYDARTYTVSNPDVTDLGNGNWKLTGTVNDVQSGNAKLVFSATDVSDVEINIGSVTKNQVLNFTFSPTVAGLSMSTLYTAKIVIPDGGSGTGTAIPGAFGAVASNPFDFARKVELGPSAAMQTQLGSATYANFPVLVRLSTSIEDFDYSVFGSFDGKDMMFTDENGTSLPFEVEVWNPAGETLVWVKVPSLSASTVLTCYFGAGYPGQKSFVSADVWSRYVGVWHFAPSEAGGTTVTDATGHNLNGTTTGNLTTTTGPFGGDCLRTSAATKAPDYEPAFKVGASFTASGWFKAPEMTTSDYVTVLKKKGSTWNEACGWYTEMSQSFTKSKTILTGDAIEINGISDVRSNWHYFTVVSDGSTVKVYMDGDTTAKGSRNYKVVANAYEYTIQSAKTCNDEYRIRKGAQSAAEFAVEYQTMANAAFFDYGAAVPTDASAPIIDTPVVVRNNDGSFTITAGISENAPVAGSVKCVIGSNEYAMSGTGIGTYSVTVSDLAADTTYTCSVKAESIGGTEVVKFCPSAFYTGNISITKESDANEFGLVPGVFRISRADTANDLEVNFTVDAVASDAIPGQTYVALVSPVTIPSGASYVDVEVVPLMDAATASNTVAKVDIASGLYGIDSNNGSATMTILNLVAPAGWNTWVATADGLASVGSNWSEGRTPIATDKVLFDGRFSNANCEWDAAATDTVAEWKQGDGDGAYSGTVTIDTVYSGDFSVMTVTGDMSVGSGKISHLANSTAETYRLNISVGGDFTLGASAKIDALGKGFAVGKARSGSAIACHASSPQGNYSYVYGNVYQPEALGSGGNNNNKASSAGGGAIKLTVVGAAVVNGTIDARSSSQKLAASNPEKGVGAGGSIWLTAASVSGTGTFNASAYTADVGETSYQEAGSGGRIAVVATTGTVSIPLANLKANCGYGKPGAGGGTIYVKSASETNGTLLVGSTKGHEWNYQVRYPAKKAVTIVPPGESWTFDRVYVRGYGIIGVPEGATLALPNGFASVSNTETPDPACGGILYLGGTINATKVDGRHTISGSWFFQADTPFTFDGDLYCDNKAGIGNFFLLQPQATNIVHNIVTVNGDMTVTSSGRIYAAQRGHRNTGSEVLRGTHGGIALNSISLGDVPYDSIFHPMYSGFCGQNTGSGSGDSGNTNDGSGAIKLTVTGTLQLDSTANFNTVDRTGDFHRGGAGSFDLTCGFLTGSGAISANGTQGSGEKYAGGGGRIAVKLTGNGATISDTWKANINAKGNSGGKGEHCYSSAGTVYLQNADEADGAGTIIVRNTGNTAITSPTILPGAKWGAETAAELKKAKLMIEGASIVRPAETMKMDSIEVASNSKLDLYGSNLTVKKASIGGVKVSIGKHTLPAGGESTEFQGLVNTGDAAGTLEVVPTGLVVIFK